MANLKTNYKLQLGGYTHDVMIELDPIRSQVPPIGTGQGYVFGAAGAAMSQVSFSFQVASNHAFHLDTLIIDNQQEAGIAVFYDGPGTSAPMFRLPLGQSEGTVITGLKGILFGSIPMVSFNGSQLGLRIGGLIRERTSE